MRGEVPQGCWGDVAVRVAGLGVAFRLRFSMPDGTVDRESGSHGWSHASLRIRDRVVPSRSNADRCNMALGALFGLQQLQFRK